jgi:hypothetical protein
MAVSIKIYDTAAAAAAAAAAASSSKISGRSDCIASADWAVPQRSPSYCLLLCPKRPAYATQHSCKPATKTESGTKQATEYKTATRCGIPTWAYTRGTTIARNGENHFPQSCYDTDQWRVDVLGLHSEITPRISNPSHPKELAATAATNAPRIEENDGMSTKSSALMRA